MAEISSLTGRGALQLRGFVDKGRHKASLYSNIDVGGVMGW